MANSHPTNQENRDATSSRGGWTPSRGFLIGMGGVVAFAAVMVAASAFAAIREPEPVSVSEATPLPEPAQVSVAQRETTPPDDLTRIMIPPAGVAQALALVTAPGSGSSATVESPITVASSWSMSPLPEEGDANVVASGTSMDPIQQTSSSTAWVLGE